jgi:hypothetical protein
MYKQYSWSPGEAAQHISCRLRFEGDEVEETATRM